MNRSAGRRVSRDVGGLGKQGVERVSGDPVRAMVYTQQNLDILGDRNITSDGQRRRRRPEMDFGNAVAVLADQPAVIAYAGGQGVAGQVDRNAGMRHSKPYPAPSASSEIEAKARRFRAGPPLVYRTAWLTVSAVRTRQYSSRSVMVVSNGISGVHPVWSKNFFVFGT